MIARIPALNTTLRLHKDTHITLMAERRNRKLWNLHHSPPTVESIGYTRPRFRPTRLTPLYAGDTFKVDRIYIRQGADQFSSVTLRGETKHDGVYHKVRFWVSLDDFNMMELEIVDV